RARRRILLHREVNVRALLFHQVQMFHTRDDADDRQPLAVAGDLDAPAERVARRPVTTHERFIDNRDKWRFAVIGCLEIAALQKWNSKSGERSRRDTLDFSLFDLRDLPALGRLLSFDDDAVDVTAVAER